MAGPQQAANESSSNVAPSVRMHRGSRCDGDDLFDESIRLTSVSVVRQGQAALMSLRLSSTAHGITTASWEYAWPGLRCRGLSNGGLWRVASELLDG